MNGVFKLNAIRLALCMAFPVAFNGSALAAEPFPSLPPALSTSVTPNIMLYIDTSGSMVQDINNLWITEGLCNLQYGTFYFGTDPYTAYSTEWDYEWGNCLNATNVDGSANTGFTIYRSPGKKSPYKYNGGSAYQTAVDADANTKMNTARRVAKKIVDANPTLRFGLFTFDDKKANIGGNERGQAGKLRYAINDMSVPANKTALFKALDEMYGRTGTPLAEGLLDITRYFEGKSSLYKSGVTYTSPIQYRCQKNFVLLITDGNATGDQNLPGSGRDGEDGNGSIGAMSYTPRDSDGNAVTGKKFSVCKAADAVADDGLTVNCPATLDGTATSRVFVEKDSKGNITNLPSAIRDVAMYANVADLRVGGNDDDKKSFDDPKFAKQNLVTYTIGFAVDNPVLPAAASVGEGKYYNTKDETTLSAALADAVNSIVASTSNAGGLATTIPYKQSGNKLFQPVFNPNGWYGELRCYDYASITFTATGAIDKGACSIPKALIPAESSRKIWSAKWAPATGQLAGSGATSGAGAFEFTTAKLASFPCKTADDATATMTCAQQNALGAKEVDQQNTVKFVRGIDGTTLTDSNSLKLRSRTTLLGDITDSQPLVVGPSTGVSNDSAYAAFQSGNDSRAIVLIGANDGMLHAFNVSDMKELMGYIPSPLYRRLDDLTKADYGNSGGTAHVYGVNGELRQTDVKLGTAWKTLVVGGLAQGGQGFFAVDATSSSALVTSASVKWEWNDQHDNEMGYTFGAPLIYNVRTSATQAAPAVVLVNGYENNYDDTADGGKKSTSTTSTSALYILDADTGALQKKIAVTGGAGLSSPAGVDVGQDGILDYVYAGDINGKLWRFDLTDGDKTKLSGTASLEPTLIFDAGKPITLRPAIKPIVDSDGKSRGNLILFGTGKLQTDTDRSTIDAQSLYGILDDMTATPTVTRANLVERVVDSVQVTVADSSATTRDGTYRAIAPLSGSVTLDLTSKTETKKGWYIDLPTESERLVSSPVLLDQMVLFGTGIPKTSEKCVPGGAGWVMGLNPLTGGITKDVYKKDFSFVDVELDDKSDVKDKLTFSSATGTTYASGFSTVGIPTELTYVADQTKIMVPDGNGGTLVGGSSVAIGDANKTAIFTGNGALGADGKSTVTTGSPVGRPVPDPTKGGEIVFGGLGNSNFKKVRLNPCEGTCSSTKTYTIDTTIWREIK